MDCTFKIKIAKLKISFLAFQMSPKAGFTNAIDCPEAEIQRLREDLIALDNHELFESGRAAIDALSRRNLSRKLLIGSVQLLTAHAKLLSDEDLKRLAMIVLAALATSENANIVLGRSQSTLEMLLGYKANRVIRNPNPVKPC